MINGDGWLRVQGNQFYAYSRPEAVIMEDGSTLADFLGATTKDGLVSAIAALQKRCSTLEDLVSKLIATTSASTSASGIYPIKQADLTNLVNAQVVDSDTLYFVSENNADVTVRVVWKSNGEVLKQSFFSNKVGSVVDVDLLQDLFIDGRTYSFTVVKEGYTNAQAKCYKPLESKLYLTKNAVLEVNSSEVK